MRAELYINGRRADVAECTHVLLNWSQSDLTDPTAVKNSYSQQVKLPLTPNNNEIFDTFRRNDWRHNVGFSPLEKLQFELRKHGGEVAESGYLKLDAVQSGEGGYYACTLYGGLGQFLYALMYDSASGDKLTLADLWFNIGWSVMKIKGYTDATAAEVKAAWDVLNSGGDGLFGIINFAVTDDGYPENFDADKIWDNRVEGTAIYELGTDKDAFEMKEFRADKLRQVINIGAFLDALALPENAGSVTFEVAQEVAQSPLFRNLWMVLPWPDVDDITDPKGPMQITQSPADYLLAIVKMFGLRLVAERGHVTLMNNSAFFTQTIHDWQDRVDASKFDITPTLADSRYFNIAVEVQGEFADDYAKRLGRPYGNQRVDTGYDFNRETKELLEDIAFKGAADVHNYELATAFTQLHDDGGKPTEGAGTLLLHVGTVHPGVTWRLSEATDDMLAANDAVPCWNGFDGVIGGPDFPHFRRLNAEQGVTLEIGRPLEVATFDDWDDVVTVYDDWWAALVRDRYNVNTRAVRCKVNLSGLQVGVSLLRDFYAFDGSLWSLNRISDYDADGGRQTECEFVRVNDPVNYGSANRRYISVSVHSLYFPATGGTQYIQVDGNMAWTITQSGDAGVTVTPLSGGVDGVGQRDTVTVVATGGLSASRSGVLTLTASDGTVLRVTWHIDGTGPVTQGYYVNKSDCISCGMCGAVCPVRAISFDTSDKAEIDQDVCISCGRCLDMCPTGAIVESNT